MSSRFLDAVLRRQPAVRQAGLSLIELLVAITIGLVLTLAVTSVVTIGEAHRRTTTSTNDMDQTGAYAAYLLDRAIRSAGSGIVQSTQPIDRGVFGCKLNVGTMLPRATPFPAPFVSFLAGATETLRVAPVMIASGQSSAGSDVLVVMGGYAGAGGISRPVTNPGTATTLLLDNTIGLAAKDSVLVSQSGTSDCLFEQVASVEGQTVTLDSSTAYYTPGASNLIADLSNSTSTYVTPLGSAAAGSLQFQLFGVGDNNTLFSYDLLRASGGDTTQAIADGVLALRGLYGLDTDGDGVVDAWADPSAPGYDIAAVMGKPATIRQIMAIRVNLVLRSGNYEKNAVSTSSLTLFGDAKNAAGTSIKQTITLSSDQQHYRYRVIDSVIPLRNMLLLP